MIVLFGAGSVKGKDYQKMLPDKSFAALIARRWEDWIPSLESRDRRCGTKMGAHHQLLHVRDVDSRTTSRLWLTAGWKNPADVTVHETTRNLLHNRVLLDVLTMSLESVNARTYQSVAADFFAWIRVLLSIR